MVKTLNKEEFKNSIFNFEESTEWNYKEEIPSIIDFYADWCGPCKMIAPVMEELSEIYEGRVNFYKVDVEQEQEISSVFGIRSIPSILFVPKKGGPQMVSGAIPKSKFEEIIKENLLN